MSQPFGDETFWTDTLHLNLVIMSAVDPTTALAVGLKVDEYATGGLVSNVLGLLDGIFGTAKPPEQAQSYADAVAREEIRLQLVHVEQRRGTVGNRAHPGSLTCAGRGAGPGRSVRRRRGS